MSSSPGIPLSDLRLRVGLGWGSFYHQLRFLEAAGVVRLEEAGGRRLVVPAGWQEGEDALQARGILIGATARSIAHLIATRAATDVTRIASASGLSVRTVSYHVRRLVEGGLATSASRSRYVDLRPTPLLLRLLDDNPASGPPDPDEHSPSP